MFFPITGRILVQCSRYSWPERNFRFATSDSGLSGALERGHFYFSTLLFFLSVTPFFLRMALSAARWKFCPSRNGCNVTCAAGIRVIPKQVLLNHPKR